MKEVGFSTKDSFAFEVNNQAGSNRTATKEEMADNLFKLIQLVMASSLSIKINNLYIKTNIDTWKNSVAWEKYADFFREINVWPEQWTEQHENPMTIYPWGKGNWSYWEYSSKGKIDGVGTDVLLSKINPHF